MRLLVHVEGPTEETFVRAVLCPHLVSQGYSSVTARLMGNARPRKRRSGGVSWQSVQQGILRHLKADRQAVATTMVDYYGMPQSRSRKWPSRIAANGLPFEQKATTIQNALARDIREHMGKDFDQSRFIPYVSMHEFEVLLFCDCQGFADSIEDPKIGSAMQEILDQFGNPEKINDSQKTPRQNASLTCSQPTTKWQWAPRRFKKSVWRTFAASAKTLPVGYLGLKLRQSANLLTWSGQGLGRGPKWSPLPR